jgi:hypothetical protein
MGEARGFARHRLARERLEGRRQNMVMNVDPPPTGSLLHCFAHLRSPPSSHCPASACDNHFALGMTPCKRVAGIVTTETGCAWSVLAERSRRCIRRK